MACSVYGALGWNLCGSHSVFSAHEAFGLVRFHGAFRVPEALGRGALVAFTALVLFRKCWGWMFCGFHSSCSFWAGPLFVAFRVLVVFMVHYVRGFGAECFLGRLLCFYC